VTGAKLSWGVIASVYSLLYIAAVSLDHLSTILPFGFDAIESNPLFRGTDGSLTNLRAIGVFLLAWPFLLGSLWVGRTRALHGNAAWSHPVANLIIGRTGYSALRVPFIVVIIKALAGVLNIANVYLPVTTTQVLRSGLKPIGIWSPSLGYFLTAGILLVIAAQLARWPTRRLLDTITNSKPS